MDKKKRQALAKGVKAVAATAAGATIEQPKMKKEGAKLGSMPKLPKLPSASKTRKPKPLVACTCGCEGMTRGLWVPGHDARARGWAMRIERAICKMADVPANEQAGAKFMLKQRKDLGTASEGIKLVKSKKPEPVAEPEPVSAVVNE